MKKYITGALAPIVIFLAIIVFFNITANQAQAANQPLTGWAWSSNIGWISFNSTNSGAGGGGPYSVQLDNVSGVLSGYAWSSNVGWISFNHTDVVGCLPVPANGSCDPTVNITNGTTTGWARLISDGSWIELSGANHWSNTANGGVTYSSDVAPNSYKFTGFAWEPNEMGWIDFAAGGTGSGVDCVGPNCPNPNPPLTVLSCTSNPAGNPVSIVPGNMVAFTATVTGGTGPFTYTLTPGDGGTVAPDSNDPVASHAFTYTYNTVQATPYLSSVIVTDSKGATTGQISCGNISVTNTPAGGAVTLKIGVPNVTLTDLNSVTGKVVYSIKKSQSFGLAWTNTIPNAQKFPADPNGYECTRVIPSNAPAIWKGSGLWGDPSLTNVTSSNSINSMTAPVTGSFGFAISCISATHKIALYPDIIIPANLEVHSSSGGEI